MLLVLSLGDVGVYVFATQCLIALELTNERLAQFVLSESRKRRDGTHRKSNRRPN